MMIWMTKKQFKTIRAHKTTKMRKIIIFFYKNKEKRENIDRRKSRWVKLLMASKPKSKVKSKIIKCKKHNLVKWWQLERQLQLKQKLSKLQRLKDKGFKFSLWLHRTLHWVLMKPPLNQKIWESNKRMRVLKNKIMNLVLRELLDRKISNISNKMTISL